MIRFLIAACVLLSPLSAGAHAFLDGALPRVGSEIPRAPKEIVLHFTQAVEPAFSRIEVEDGAGGHVTVGTAHTLADDATRFAITLAVIAPGSYTVIWHVTSVDTHKTQGKFHFTVTH